MSIQYSDTIKPFLSLTGTSTATSTGFVAKNGTATSVGIDVSKRQLVSIQFTGSAITTGNGIFTVKVSNDGVTYVPYTRLTDNFGNTNLSGVTLVKDPNKASSSKMLFFPSNDSVRLINVAVNVTTDGTYGCVVHAKG